MYGGPCDGAISKVQSDDKAAVRQRMAVNHIREGRIFVPRSNPYRIARLPGTKGENASAAWTDIVGIRALLAVGATMPCLGETYYNNDGKPPFHPTTERVIQRHVAQTLTGQIRNCGGALILMQNVHDDLRKGSSNWRADGSFVRYGDWPQTQSPGRVAGYLASLFG